MHKRVSNTCLTEIQNTSIYELQPNQQLNANYLFYTNQLACKPHGVFIDDLIDSLLGSYSVLENDHNYIQWLFPTKEQGVNELSQPLTDLEIDLMRKDSSVLPRLLRAYHIMLDFYGISLTDIRLTVTNQGNVKRSTKYRQRFNNVKRNPHNNLRITRILKCLVLLGLQHLVKPLLDFLKKEIFDSKLLACCKRSYQEYWLPVLKSTCF